MTCEAYQSQIKISPEPVKNTVSLVMETGLPSWKNNLESLLPQGTWLGNPGNYGDGTEPIAEEKIKGDCDDINRGHEGDLPQNLCALQIRPSDGSETLTLVRDGERTDFPFDPISNTLTMPDGTTINPESEIDKYFETLPRIVASPIPTATLVPLPSSTQEPITVKSILAKNAEVLLFENFDSHYGDPRIEYTNQNAGNGSLIIDMTDQTVHTIRKTGASYLNLSAFCRSLGMSQYQTLEFAEDQGVGTPMDRTQDILTSKTINLPVLNNVVNIPVIDPSGHTIYIKVPIKIMKQTIEDNWHIDNIKLQSILAAQEKLNQTKMEHKNVVEGVVALAGRLGEGVALVALFFYGLRLLRTLDKKWNKNNGNNGNIGRARRIH